MNEYDYWSKDGLINELERLQKDVDERWKSQRAAQGELDKLRGALHIAAVETNILKAKVAELKGWIEILADPEKYEDAVAALFAVARKKDAEALAAELETHDG